MIRNYTSLIKQPCEHGKRYTNTHVSPVEVIDVTDENFLLLSASCRLVAGFFLIVKPKIIK